MSDIRVRFAPSPSSPQHGMHIGNAKTAMFNCLFAKSNGAEFLFRIENSDQERTVDGCADKILEELKWLGIYPTMGYGTDNKPAGIYTQAERFPIYRKYVNRLIEQGFAYKCYCTQEELDKKREEALAKDPKKPFKYPGTCRNIKDNLDKPHVIRFKAPTEGYTEFEDITFGKRQIPNKENYDFVLMRADGSFLYNTCVVIDDGIIDKITHVIRGSDHLKNLVPQILLYQALDIPTPTFCHLPMVMSPTGKGKLSKRDGSVSIDEYKKQGYAPQAILNYLAKFGWSLGNKEVFSFNEMIENFKLEDCHCRDGKYDPVKFLSINYEHLKSETLTPNDDYVKLLKPFIDAKNIGNITEEQLKPFVNVVRARAKTFAEAANLLEPMLRSEVQAAPELIERTFNEKTTVYLQCLNDLLVGVENWNEESLRNSVQHWLQQEQLSLKDIGGVMRVALLGQQNSPEIFSVMNALGKDKSLSRINKTLAQLKENGN